MDQTKNLTPEEIAEKYKLSDDAIIEISHSFDQWLVDIGEKHTPLAIQLASIAMGRLMVFTNHTNQFKEFQELLRAITAMEDPDAFIKAPDEEVGDNDSSN